MGVIGAAIRKRLAWFENVHFVVHVNGPRLFVVIRVNQEIDRELTGWPIRVKRNDAFFVVHRQKNVGWPNRLAKNLGSKWLKLSVIFTQQRRVVPEPAIHFVFWSLIAVVERDAWPVKKPSDFFRVVINVLEVSFRERDYYGRFH